MKVFVASHLHVRRLWEKDVKRWNTWAILETQGSRKWTNLGSSRRLHLLTTLEESVHDLLDSRAQTWEGNYRYLDRSHHAIAYCHVCTSSENRKCHVRHCPSGFGLTALNTLKRFPDSSHLQMHASQPTAPDDYDCWTGNSNRNL